MRWRLPRPAGQKSSCRQCFSHIGCRQGSNKFSTPGRLSWRPPHRMSYALSKVFVVLPKEQLRAVLYRTSCPPHRAWRRDLHCMNYALSRAFSVLPKQQLWANNVLATLDASKVQASCPPQRGWRRNLHCMNYALSRAFSVLPKLTAVVGKYCFSHTGY